MGDKKNAIKKLQQSIRSIKYPSLFELKEMDIGSPREYLKLFHYLFMDYSPLIAQEILTKHNMELNSKNDKAFIDGVYKIIRDMFAYVPKLNRDQFFTPGFAQVKAQVACEIIELIRGKLKSLQPATVSCIASSSCLLAQPKKDYLALPRDQSLPKSLSSNSIDSKVHKLGRTASTSRHTKIEHRNNHKLLDNSTTTKVPLTQAVSTSSSNQADYSLITKSLENFNSKYEHLAQRLLPLESRINQTMEAVTESCQKKPEVLQAVGVSLIDFNRLMSRVSMLERENENLKDRIIILESQNLSKHLLSNYTDRTRERESMSEPADATLFHSFIDNNSGGEQEDNCYNGKDMGVSPFNKQQGRMFQGEAVDLSHMNDSSVDGNDLTPTLDTTKKQAKFNSIESNIMRAKELVSKASMLSNNMKSM